MLKKVKTLIALLIFVGSITVVVTEAIAQGRKGSIKGRVTDSSGGVLQGAQISIDPTGVTAGSDVQGQFLINDLDPGSYTVTVTYVGLAKFTQNVNVAAGQPASVEAKLALESQNLKILVSAERPAAEVEAVNR